MPAPPSIFAEDLRLGETFALGARALIVTEIVEFGRLWDPLAFHVDPRAAESSKFGGLVASGVQTIALFQRMCVDQQFSHWALLAGRSFRDVVFVKPVRPGVKLSGSLSVAEVAHRSPRSADVVLDGLLLDDDEHTVFTMTLVISMQRRTEGSA